MVAFQELLFLSPLQRGQGQEGRGLLASQVQLVTCVVHVAREQDMSIKCLPYARSVPSTSHICVWAPDDPRRQLLLSAFY